MEIITSLFNSIVTIVTNLGSMIVSAIDFILLIFVKLPFIITNDLFSQLPFIFRYGLLGWFGIVISIYVSFILSLLKLN